MKTWIANRRVKFLNSIWIKGLLEERNEYLESFKILDKFSKTKKIYPEEISILQNQLWNTLKLTGVAIIFILPGGTILLSGLVFISHKTGLQIILPKAFRNK